MIRKLLSFTVAKTYLITQLITRIILCGYALFDQQIEILELPGILVLGIINDFCSLLYFLPLALLIIALFHKILSNKLPRTEYYLAQVAFFITIATLLFNGIAELAFWDEFGTKFNFIAVDYLIYTNEIIGTLKDTIDPTLATIGITLPSVIITYLSRKYIYEQIQNIRVISHLLNAIIFGVVSIVVFYLYNPKKLNLSSNRYAQELSLNGPYEFFSAYNNNSLDYNQLYPKINKDTAINISRQNIDNTNSSFLNDTDIDRWIEPVDKTTQPKKYNIVIITVESLSAEFMGKFGNNEGNTPNLDSLADESIFFTKLYATGTRTVRGLEAISLGVPPTPGSSIIRRPKNQDLFNIGSVFHKFDYDVNFIFGGYSYFDNLESYFTANNFKITDRASLKADEISFANIWGVADEDILMKSLEIGDANYAAAKPFFSLIMTTSNHRPYTFPSGRIDKASGSGRGAAVKYTDYAIGKFIEAAKLKPWFDETIFIITADHCASSAGKSNLPIHKYHIPMLIYAPKILEPQKIENLASQIDIAPTIFGLLNFEYRSKFFGSDIINQPANRAFISTYQLLGFLENEHLVILSPNSKPQIYKIDGEEKTLLNNHDHAEQINEAIGYYQAAYDLYVEDKMQNFKD